MNDNGINYGGFRKAPSIGRWDPSKTRRKKITIQPSDIYNIASMWFINNSSLGHIALLYMVSESDIKKIIQGENFIAEWCSAVVRLLSEGHDVSRRIVKKPTINGRSQTAEKVRRIRTTGKETQKTSHEIAADEGVAVDTVRRILRGKTYRQDIYCPDGWEKPWERE